MTDLSFPDPPEKLSELLLGHVNIIPVLAMNDGNHATKMIKANTVGITPILKAQFNHPLELAKFHIVFLSGDGLYAATVRNNQHQHHPEQSCSAFGLNDIHVMQLLEHFMRVHDWQAWDIFGWKKKARTRSFAESIARDEEEEDDEDVLKQKKDIEITPKKKKKKKIKSFNNQLSISSQESKSSVFTLPPALPLELRQPAVHYHRNVGKGSLMATASSSSPNLSLIWWWLKHPNLRVAVAAAMIPLDMFIYVSDPVSYSTARKFGFLHRFFNFSNSEVTALHIVYRLLLCMFVSMFSIMIALVTHRILRDCFSLPLFGYMKPRDVKYKRWRLSHQDGTLYLVIVTFCWTIFFGIKGYFMFLTDTNNNDDGDNDNEGVRMVILRWSMALLCLVKDWFILVVVIDHILQEVRQRYTVGFDAYVKSPAVEYVTGLEEWKRKERFHNLVAESHGHENRPRGGEFSNNSVDSLGNSMSSSIMSGLSMGSQTGRVASVDSSVSDMEGGSKSLDRLQPLSKKGKEKMIRNIIDQSWLVIASKWWRQYRLRSTRALLIVGWTLIVCLLVSYLNYILRVLDASDTDEVGWSFFWNAGDVSEKQRVGAVTTSALFNLVILMQDWDIADWHNVDLRIVGCNIKDVTVKLPAFIDYMLRHHRELLINFHRHAIIHNHHLSFSPGKRRLSQSRTKKKLNDHHVSQHVHHSYLYVSVKWLTFLPLFLFASFDWLHWWSVLTYRPCDYLQLWESATGYLYSISNELVELGKVTNCSSYVDNQVIGSWGNQTFTKLIRIESVKFQGHYTYNEEGQYVFDNDGTVRLWLMCLLPLLAWVVFLWIVCTHGKQHCLNGVNIEKAAFWDREYIPDAVTDNVEAVKEEEGGEEVCIEDGEDGVAEVLEPDKEGNSVAADQKKVSSISTLLDDDWRRNPGSITEGVEEDLSTPPPSPLAPLPMPFKYQDESEEEEGDGLGSTVRKVLFSATEENTQAGVIMTDSQRRLSKSGSGPRMESVDMAKELLSSDWKKVTEKSNNSRSRSFDRLHKERVGLEKDDVKEAKEIINPKSTEKLDTTGCIYKKKQEVEYKQSDGTWITATIQDISYDEALEPYFTVSLGGDPNREKSTIGARLRPMKEGEKDISKKPNSAKSTKKISESDNKEFKPKKGVLHKRFQDRLNDPNADASTTIKRGSTKKRSSAPTPTSDKSTAVIIKRKTTGQRKSKLGNLFDGVNDGETGGGTSLSRVPLGTSL